MMNEQTKTAQKVIDFYKDECSSNESIEKEIEYVICDLMHLAKYHNCNWDTIIAGARNYFRLEKNDK